MTSTIFSPLELNAELRVAILHGTGGPDADYPNAPIGSKYWHETTGDWYSRKPSGWIQDGVASAGAADWASITGKPSTRDGYGISDVYTKTESDARYWTQAQADARYLKLAGGTLTGTLTVGGTYGWAVGGVASTPRIHYGSDSATGFSLLTAANGYADVYLRDVKSARDATSAAIYLGGDGAAWLYRHSNILDVHGMHVAFDDGFGIRSQSGLGWYAHTNAQYWQLVSAGATAAVQLWRNGSTLCGYLYADSGAIGLLNNTGQWALLCNYGSGMGGQLVGAWSVSTNLSVSGQIGSNTLAVTNGISCGGLTVNGYAPTVNRSSPISGGVPGDLASGQVWWGY